MLSAPEMLLWTLIAIAPGPVLVGPPVAVTWPSTITLPVSGAVIEIPVEPSPTTVIVPLLLRSPISGASSATPKEFLPWTLTVEPLERVSDPVSDPGPTRRMP